jgi:trimeric autotransporter adhesin
MRICLSALLAVLVTGPVFATLLGSSISVQGVLSANGQPADGVYDLRITPYPDPALGPELAPAIELDNVFFLEGAFTARVDFGRSLFLGDEVYFEIAIRPGTGGGDYEVLSPRQLVTAAPYAMKPAAASVTDLELAMDAVGSPQILDGSVRSAELADAAVSSQKLVDGAVTSSKLGDGAVGTTKLSDAAVTTSKIDSGAVATAALADAAVTQSKLAPDSVDSVRIVDGSIAAADLQPGLLALPSWNLNGNALTSGQFLGTTNATALDLRSDVGVTINGSRFNNNTELTIRGSPTTAETNADLTLWPRAGTAFFNLSAVGNDPAASMLAVSSVGTSPFTGYVARLILSYSGQLGIGGSDPTPVATVHATRADLGVDIGDLADSYEFIAEDADAQLALLSNTSGGSGSSLLLGEFNAGTFVNGWGLWRATGATTRVPLNIAYGSSNVLTANPSRLSLYNDGALFVGNVAPSAAPQSSFLFTDASSVSTFNTSAANQFLIRAVGGVAINRTPASSAIELSIAPSTAGGSADLVLGPTGSSAADASITMGTPGTETAFRVTAGSSPSGNGFFTVASSNSATAETPAMQIITSGSSFTRQLSLFRGKSDGSYLLPTFPIHVGDSTIPNSGNGAHLTSGGSWVNGSSRGFKQDFSRLDTAAVLDRLLGLPIRQWRYKGADHDLHYGPVAEEFKAAFGLGGDARYIATVDADGVALAAIQGLNAKLERENQQLREALTALSARVDRIEQGRGGSDASR